MISRSFLTAAFLAGVWALPAVAQSGSTRNDVMVNVERCAGITDDRTWLNCYYGAAQPMRAQLGLAPAPDSQVNLVKNAPVTPPPMKSASSGGGWFSGIGDIFNTSSSPSDSDFGTGAMRLTAYSYGKDGLFTATLADGEVWTQSQYDDLRAHWSGPATDYTVMVSSDMFGSHTMRVKGDRDYRVIRVK